jgi:thiol-disulfide isomerase/thioredoxin
LQQSSPSIDSPDEKPPRSPFDRIWDVLAVVLIAFVAWRLIVSPRSLETASAAPPAPHVAFERLDGGTFRLADQRGRLVFLDFWASWCAPCKQELPLVEAFARSHPASEVVAVNVGEPRSVVAAFVRRHPIRNVVLDPGATSQGYFQIEGFPTVVVVGPEGKIRATWAGFNPAIALAMANAESSLVKR